MANIDITDAATGGGGGGSGTVTSVGLSVGTTGTNITVSGSPVTTSGTLTINIPTASATNTGRLSSTDWSTFNNKQAALVSGTNIKTINGSSILGAGNLVVSGTPAGSTGYVQFNTAGAFNSDADFFWDNTNKYLGIGTVTPSGELHVDGGAAIPRMILDADTNVARIFSFRTNDLPRWAFRVDNTESGSNAGSDLAIRRYNDAGTFVDAPISINRATGLTTVLRGLNLSGSVLSNFIPNLPGTAVNLTIDSSNSSSYNGSVCTLANAITITLDASLPNGFTITFLQLTSNQTTFAGSGGLVIGNRQGHTKNNGLYSVVSVVKITNVLAILGGDTAA
jgi:hypothetical protein